jgi:hypothetical protein
VSASVFAMFAMSVHASNADRLRPASSDSQHTAIGKKPSQRDIDKRPGSLRYHISGGYARFAPHTFSRSLYSNAEKNASGKIGLQVIKCAPYIRNVYSDVERVSQPQR